MNFSLRKFASVLTIGAALLFAGNASAVQLDYSNSNAGLIEFDGAGNFSFTPGTGNVDIDTGSAAGLLAEITGTFSIGAITISGPLQSAPVSGVGGFSIADDGFGFSFSADLVWIDIFTLGTAGGANTGGTLNMTNIVYGGANPDLMALVSAGAASNTMTFQFNPARTLTSLKSSSGKTTFSGSITATPDGGTTVTLLGVCFVGMAMVMRRRKA